MITITILYIILYIYIDTSFIYQMIQWYFKGLHCMEFLSIWTKVLALGKLFTWQPYQDTLRQWLETRVDSSHNGFTLGRFREILLLSSFGLVAVLNMPYICIYFHIYIHIHIYTYSHIYIYTYTHIHIYTYFKGNPRPIGQRILNNRKFASTCDALKPVLLKTRKMS